MDGEEGDGSEDDGVDWMLHSNTSPDLTEEAAVFKLGLLSKDDGNLE